MVYDHRPILNRSKIGAVVAIAGDPEINLQLVGFMSTAVVMLVKKQLKKNTRKSTQFGLCIKNYRRIGCFIVTEQKISPF